MNQEQRPPDGRQPTLGPTRPATLVVAALVAAAVAWLGISQFYYSFVPRLSWPPAVTIAVVALLEGVTAFSTKARIDRKPGTSPVDPLAVARLVVIAKASSLTGAILVGAYGGSLIWLLGERTRTAAAASDVAPVAAGLAAALLLVGAALWLEFACRVPKRPDDEDEKPDRR